MRTWFYDEQHEQCHVSEALSPDDGDLFAADLERITASFGEAS